MRRILQRYAFTVAPLLPAATFATTASADEPLPVEAPAPARAFPPLPVATPIAPAPAPSQEAGFSLPITGKLYGFIEERAFAIGAEPNGNVNANGTPSRYAPNFDLAIPAVHVMAQGTMYSRFRYYLNLAAFDADQPTFDAPIAVRNAWLESSIFGDYLNVRVGKMYRRFGFYNEILDTVPSFIGVEAPVYLSGDRPMLTRTTNAMIHGRASSGNSTLVYSLTAGKDESSAGDDVWSPGLDVNYSYDSKYILGTSLYSTGGTVQPSVALGSGAPASGVAAWMQQDRYDVYGGYAGLNLGGFALRAEAWVSPHDSTRDPQKVLDLAQNAANFSPTNRARMGLTSTNPTAAQVITNVHYIYTTVDVRAFYTFDVGSDESPVELTPYIDFDYSRNKESISDLRYGGDGSSGESPNGIALHERLGCVFKPVPPVAFKAEVNLANYLYGSSFASNPELWLSLSFQWELIR